MDNYTNDFAQRYDAEEPERPSWEGQPITIPLAEWTALLLENADLRARMDALAVKWAAANEDVRHLRNEVARLEGESAEKDNVIHALREDLDAFFEEGGD